jgi:DNA-binding winged helix-turn-helix (wHTH) protein
MRKPASALRPQRAGELSRGNILSARGVYSASPTRNRRMNDAFITEYEGETTCDLSVRCLPITAPQPLNMLAEVPRNPRMAHDTIEATSDVEASASRIDGFSPPLAESRTLIFACWRLDLVTQELRTADDAPLTLSRAEFELLYVLAKHPHRWLTRQQILHFMKGHARLSRARSIDVYVSRLRHKLEADIRTPKIIQTVRNGYKLAAAVTIC